MFTVTISDKGGQQSRLEFNKSEISIGRMKGNDIVLPKGNVSKRHASIYVRDDAIYVNDHGSTNGTYINGRKVSAEQQVDGEDRIYIGDFILQLDRSGARGAPPDPPGGGNQRNTMPPMPPGGGPGGGSGSGATGSGEVEGNRVGNDTIFDPFGGDGPQADPLRQTFTTLPPSSAEQSADPSRHGGAYNDGVPEGARDTLGAHEELQQVGPPPGRKFDAVPYGSESAPPANSSGERERERTPSSASPSVPSPSSSGSSAPKPSVKKSSPGPDRRDPPRSSSRRHEPPRGGSSPSRRGSSPPPISVESSVSALQVQAPEVLQEFDSDFFVAQLDVARVLFEDRPIEQMPMSYPPEGAAREEYGQAVDAALDKVNPSVDRELLRELLVAEATELGPIDLYLSDDEIRDIYVNRYDQILLRRDGQLVQAPHVFSTPDTLEMVAHRLLGSDIEEVGADEMRFGDGTRVHVVMPPLAVDGPLITIRKPPASHPTLEELVERGVLSMSMADFLMRAIDAGRSIAVAGPTSSGKTTLISALAGLIYEGMRIISIEDYSHMELPQGSSVRMEANPSAGYDKRFLLRNALAMHPQRIILDECRGAEAYDWVTAVASGTEGSMLTVHGTSAADALGRLESLCLLGSHEISPRGLREQIARAVNLVVVVNRVNDEGFRVQQVTEVQGVDLDAFRLNDIFYYRVEGAEGAFHPTGYIPLFYEDLRNAGVQVDFDIFQE